MKIVPNYPDQAQSCNKQPRTVRWHRCKTNEETDTNQELLLEVDWLNIRWNRTQRIHPLCWSVWIWIWQQTGKLNLSEPMIGMYWSGAVVCCVYLIYSMNGHCSVLVLCLTRTEHQKPFFWSNGNTPFRLWNKSFLQLISTSWCCFTNSTSKSNFPRTLWTPNPCSHSLPSLTVRVRNRKY